MNQSIMYVRRKGICRSRRVHLRDCWPKDHRPWLDVPLTSAHGGQHLLLYRRDGHQQRREGAPVPCILVSMRRQPASMGDTA